ncbi:CKLF-like MARVEL transmembrane domain-containing protein 6 isoform X2 [Aquila chrysaetos chrysaetos]|uniref:CKLF-like MARVEL transmembrane domain-containing protein 6 isoform X2 n=1 Tax=Aquila chrysaetos chrysaetos TaxID=223781 RepID=UPI0005D0C127|nr:CKLF-like MARVEL transmembrane domain-containing protein 6 isoform X2 [Aquila chrysaetos chrysaetos]
MVACVMRPRFGAAACVVHLPAVIKILSLLAVICEEIVEGCIKCGGLYFFEFTSCSAFLLSLLILCVYCTDVYETFGEDKVQTVNLWTMRAIAVCFLLASIVLAATISGSAVENAACVFGFLASGAFSAEIIIECFHSRKQNVDGSSENPGNAQSYTENQPLNKQS